MRLWERPFFPTPQNFIFHFFKQFLSFYTDKIPKEFCQERMRSTERQHRSECEAPSDPSPGGPLPGEVLLVLEGKEDFSLGHSANDPKRSDEHRAVPCFQWKTQRIVPSEATTTERLRKNTPPGDIPYKQLSCPKNLYPGRRILPQRS